MPARAHSTAPGPATLLVLLLVLGGATCARTTPAEHTIGNLHVEGFHSDEPADCQPSDVAIDERRAMAFFRRARHVDHRAIHDHYVVAPCYVEGTLRQDGARCHWLIRAGATAQVSCGERAFYYVCDDCDDLLLPATMLRAVH